MQGIFYCLLIGMFFLVQGTVALTQPDALFLPARAADPVSSPSEVDQLNAKSLEISDERAIAKRDPQALSQIWTQAVTILADFVGGQLNTTTGPNRALFQKNFVAEIDNAICTHYAGTAINAVLGADIVAACMAAILTGSKLDAAAEFTAAFTAGIACNIGVSFIFPPTPILSDITGFVDFICNQPKPCGNLLTDPKNCGACGNVVRASHPILYPANIP
jgi:hypothetical protein